MCVHACIRVSVCVSVCACIHVCVRAIFNFQPKHTSEGHGVGTETRYYSDTECNLVKYVEAI